VWLPGAIWLWIAGSHGAALFLFLWGTVITSFVADNLLKPFLMQGSGELSTLVVFLGVFGGLAAFGLLGLFIGPLALAVALMVLQVVRQLAREGEAANEGSRG
jgi:predicted PurR-regulated permease PerM